MGKRRVSKRLVDRIAISLNILLQITFLHKFQNLAAGLCDPLCILSVDLETINSMVEEPEGSTSAIPKLATGNDPEPALATSDLLIYPCMIHVHAALHLFVALPN
jgi:hypothetical protein